MFLTICIIVGLLVGFTVGYFWLDFVAFCKMICDR